MSEEGKGHAFSPADLVKYAMDKPVGAARAALRIALSDTDVVPDAIIDDLQDDMERNQDKLQTVAAALSKSPTSLLSMMPNEVKVRQLNIDLNC